MIHSIFQLDNHVVSALVWMLVHSLWQFTVIAVLMSVAIKYQQEKKSAVKYYMALFSLALSFFVAVGTFCYYYFDYSGQQASAAIFRRVSDIASGNYPVDSLFGALYSWIEKYQMVIFYTWIMGVILFIAKFVISMVYVEFLSGTNTPIYCLETYRAFKKTCQHYRISKNISIGESKYIKTPMILGLFKPIILFPIGVINQLDMSETEAILAHELAHFVRKDIYINVIQTFMEALLYYHPAIWWISSNIRLERESCCDDLAIGYLGDNVHYAKTLVKMQELYQNGNSPILALHFSKKESFFSNRIKRILNMTQTRNYLKEKIITSLVLLAVLVFATKEVTGANNKSAQTTETKENTTFLTKADTIPLKKESIYVKKKTNDKDISVSIEDGKVTNLEINGKKIDKDEYEKYDDIIAEVTPKTSGDSRRMFFFGDSDENPIFLQFGQDMDSTFSFKIPKDFEKFGFNQKMLPENARKMIEELYEKGHSQSDKHREILEHSLRDNEERMQMMRKEMENLGLYFRGLDSIRLGNNFMKFFNSEGDHPGFHGFKFDDEYEDAFEGLNHESKPGNFSDAIGNALNKDGLLIPGQQNKVELTGKYLKINGEKQPNNIHQKYKRIFEEVSGSTLEKNSKLNFNFEGKESKRKYRVY